MTDILSDYERGWVESLIDSEGTLGLYKNKHKPPKTKGRSFQWWVRCFVGNTNKEFLEKAQQIIGGRITERKTRGNRKKSFVLELSPNNLRVLLPQLLLVAKERQRKLIVEALVLIQEHKFGRCRWYGTPNDGRLEEIWQEMKELNRKGIYG